MKKFALLLIAALFAVCSSFGFTGAAAQEETGAETRPLFNWFSHTDCMSFDSDNEIYRVNDANLSRLSSVDASLHLLKSDYSDDLIKFSYRYAHSNDGPLAANDWNFYFTFRNFEGESPLWASQYSAHLLFFRDQMKFILVYGGSFVVEQQVALPSNLNGDYELEDTAWHSVEINIDDETGAIEIYRDKGTEEEIRLSVSCKSDDKIQLLAEGGYSFSTYRYDVEFKDLYFFNSKNTEIDDERSKFDNPDGNDGSDDSGDEPSDEPSGDNSGETPADPEKKGCKGDMGAGSIIAGAVVALSAILLKKKEH